MLYQIEKIIVGFNSPPHNPLVHREEQNNKKKRLPTLKNNNKIIEFKR